MVEKWQVTIPELGSSEARNVYVYLPKSYCGHNGRRFPVLYMFDGHNVFFDSDATYGKSWGMQEYLDREEIPLMVVAVECNHSPDHGRLREYAPFDFTAEKLGKIQGMGRQTMDWMTGVLKKEIDRRYPTLPDREHTFIAGSSMGGLMSLYAVARYNQVYSRAAALSPSIWTAPEPLGKLLKTADFRPGTVVYMDYGSREIDFHPTMRREFQEMTGLLLERKVFLTNRIVPGGNHCEASWEEQLPFFIHTLMYHV